MEITAIVKTKIKTSIEIVGLTLLSADEYERYKKFIPRINNWWWLRSPGYYGYRASYVNTNGDLDNCIVDDTHEAVRPALILKHTLNIGDKLSFAEHQWTIISEKYAICDDTFTDMAFREDYSVTHADSYLESDIKKYLDQQFEQILRQTNR